MGKANTKEFRLQRRKERSRLKTKGDAACPRLSVHRSVNHIYAQIIDDSSGNTLAAQSSVKLKIKGGNIESAKAVGKAIAEAAQAASITRVRFDRGGRLFHGRIKALADAAREAGLAF